ncbi:uncharacterized protein METZ01_LOCUS283040, partial [marine metagenome]
ASCCLLFPGRRGTARSWKYGVLRH